MARYQFIAFLCVLLTAWGCTRGANTPQTQAQDTSSLRGSPARAADTNWVTVAPNKRYLMFENGQSFVPVGVAMAGDVINFDYFGDTAIDGRRYHFKDNHFEALFEDMRAHGENFLRIDIEGTSLMPRKDIERCIAEGKIQFLEDPVGVFNETYARRIDRLVALAEKHDVYLSLVLITHTLDVTKLADNLDLYPYHKAKGGPITTMNDLMVDRRAKTLWLERMRYISKRWGYSRRIVMWELFNELLNCGTHDADAAAAWVAEMGKALRSYDLQNYGKTRPIIVSTVDFKPKHEFFYKSPGTDIMVTHYYGEETATGNPVLVAREIAKGVTDNLAQIAYARPYMENERTLAMHGPAAIQKEVEHAAAWAMMVSGALGPGCTWVRTGPWGAFRTKDVVSDTHKAMAKIVGDFNFATFDSRPSPVLSSNADVEARAVGDGRRVLGWVQHNNPDDYDIEMIRAWCANKIDNPRQTPYFIATWLRLVRKRLPSQAADGITERLGRLLSTQFGLGPVEGRRCADALLAQPGGFKSTFREVASRKRKKPNMEALKTGLLKIRSELEALEKDRQLLRKAYRGHPEVTSELRISGLTPGRHRITWYDDRTGDIVKSQTASGSEIRGTTPPFRRSIAFIVDSSSP